MQKTIPGKNVVLSPVSVALDLSMVLDGADGQTRREMLSVLGLRGLEPGAINAANAELIKVLTTPVDKVTLTVADSLWVDSRHVTLRPGYQKQMRSSYDAELTALDFSKPEAVVRINGWASKATHGRISEVIDKIDPVDRVLLLNAVYFKGGWTHQFDKALTQPHEFTLAGGSVKQVPRMVQSGRFDYFETPLLQAIRLPFGDGDLVMEILLPAKSSSLDKLEAGLSARQWQEWQTRYSSLSGTIALPRFELKSNYQLNHALQVLGLKRAFQPNAQLAGMFSVRFSIRRPDIRRVSSVAFKGSTSRYTR